MDSKQFNAIASDHPAYLFIGQTDTGMNHAITFLQKKFCLHEGCSVCTRCRKVQEQRHESILWLYPEKQYAIDDLKIIFSTISFALEPNQHFFFVIQKADLLTPTCANALLKSLEEPPAGYHFILLAQRTEVILPTIKSRCLIEYLHTDASTAPLTSLLPFFATTTFHDPLAFTKELESANPSEWESLALIDQLIIHWANIYKKGLLNHDAPTIKQADRMIHSLKKALMHPPMPGSSKLFWKNLFLQIKEL